MGAETPYSKRVSEAAIEEDLVHASVKWRSIFAGTFVALLVYAILMALGLAVGGGNLQGVIQGEDKLSGLGIGTAIWIILSVVVSIFIGAFSASHVSGLIPGRVGRIQGLAVCSLFFGILLSQAGAAIGTMGKGIGSLTGMIGGAAGDLASNSQVQQVVSDSIGDLPLKSPPDVVATGVVSRLVRGNDQAAMNYLSVQTGISRAEAQSRIASVKEDVNRIATDVGIGAAKAMKFAGWTLFGALLLGASAACIAGGLGATAALRFPLMKADRDDLYRANRPATV